MCCFLNDKLVSINFFKQIEEKKIWHVQLNITKKVIIISFSPMWVEERETTKNPTILVGKKIPFYPM